MEHPDVICEIDALIDSVDWQSLELSSNEKTTTIREVLLAQEPEDHVWLRGNKHEVVLVIAELLIHILDHPEFQKEERVLQQFSWLQMILRFRGRDRRYRFEDKKVYQGLQRYIPRFKHYLTHRNARYRAYAALILSAFGYDSNEMIDCLMNQLQRERSPRVIYHLVYSFILLFSFRHGIIVSPDRRLSVISKAEHLMHAKHPLIRLAAASLLLTVLRQKTSEAVLDVIVSAWPLIRRNDWPQYELTDEPFTGRINALGKQRACDLLVRLMPEGGTTYATYLVWDSFFYSNLRAPLGFQKLYRSKCAAFTPQQKIVLESVLASRMFWQLKSYAAYKLDDQGLEGTKARLRQQLKHARIEDRIEPSPRERDFPVRLNRELLWAKC